MMVDIPLTDDERAAVEHGQAAVAALLGRLAATWPPQPDRPHANSVPSPAKRCL